MDPEAIFKRILETGGLSGAFIVLLIIALIQVSRLFIASNNARLEDREKCQKASEQGLQARIDEAVTTRVALDKSSATLLGLISSSDTRNATAEQLARSIVLLTDAVRSLQQSQSDFQTRTERRLDEQRSVLSDMQLQLARKTSP